MKQNCTEKENSTILNTIHRDYRVKVYLNCNHSIYYNGKKGAAHPHTFEFSLYLRFPGDTFIEFTRIEDIINNFIEPYQNKLLNDIKPFDKYIPTLENIADYFAEKISTMIKDLNGVVLQIAASESPTRTYIINFNTNQKLLSDVDDFEKKLRKEFVSKNLDFLLKI